MRDQVATVRSPFEAIRQGCRDGVQWILYPRRTASDTGSDRVLRFTLEDVDTLLYGIGHRIGCLLAPRELHQAEDIRVREPRAHAVAFVREDRPLHEQSEDYKTGWVLGFYDAVFDESAQSWKDCLPRRLEVLSPERARDCRMGYEAGLNARKSGLSLRVRRGSIFVEAPADTGAIAA